MEPSVFLFFFRAVFRQFHTYVIVGEGSFSSVGEATASLTPPATASGRISFTPSHCSISEGSCPARIPPHSLTFSTLSSPFSNDRFLPAVLLTLDLQQQWCKQTSQRLTNLVMGLGDSMLFGKSFLILLLEHCCESHVTLYFRKICGGKEIQHFLFWLKISYKYLQSQLLCQVLGFGKKPQNHRHRDKKQSIVYCSIHFSDSKGLSPTLQKYYLVHLFILALSTYHLAVQITDKIQYTD